MTASVTPSLERARAVAIQAVLDASGSDFFQVQTELVDDDVVQKKDRSPVTVADYGAQAIVSHQLAKAFPKFRWWEKKMRMPFVPIRLWPKR